MPRYMSVTMLLQDDKEYLLDSLFETEFFLTNMDGRYYAISHGDASDRKELIHDIEAILTSLGAYVVETQIYWKQY